MTLGSLGPTINGYKEGVYSSKDNAIYAYDNGLVKQNTLLSYWTNPHNTLINQTSDGQYTFNPVVNKEPSVLSNVMLANNIHQQTLANKEPEWITNGLKPTMYGIQGLTTLGNLWLGFKNYGLAKKQLGIAKDQWNQTKQELDRIKTLREHLTNSYMNGE